MKVKLSFLNCALLCVIFIHSICLAGTIDVQIKGIDDGVRATKQQDYKEAVLFAKREAIERAGVKIKSITTVKDMVVNSDYIESKAGIRRMGHTRWFWLAKLELMSQKLLPQKS